MPLATTEKEGLMPKISKQISAVIGVRYGSESGIIDLGNTRGLYSIYISTTGSKVLVKFNGSTIEEIIGDIYGWISYSKNNAGFLSLYSENGHLFYQNNKNSYVVILVSIL